METIEFVRTLRREVWERISAAHTASKAEGSSQLIVIDRLQPADAGPLLEALRDDLGAHIARGTDPSRPGDVLDQLDLPDDGPLLIAVEDVGKADATSLAQIHRLLASGERPVTVALVIDRSDELVALTIAQMRATTGASVHDVDLAPIGSDDLTMALTGPDVEAFSDAILAAGASDRRILARLRAAAAGGAIDAASGSWTVAPGAQIASDELDDAQVAVAQVLVTAGTPVRADALATVTGLDEGVVLGAGDRLVRSGLATDTPKGYGAGEALADTVELTAARRAHLAQRLLAAIPESDELTRATLLSQAGDAPAARTAFTRLAEARDRAGQTAEAYWLATRALDADPDARDTTTGMLHDIRARFLRSAGWSEGAAAENQLAVDQLEGVARVAARGFAAALADDLQRPQQAERHLAMAELEAHLVEAHDQLPPLLALHARTLSRLGFPEEADAALTKSSAGLEGADDRYSVDNHRAWIELDRGQARAAESSFASLVDRAERFGPAALAAQLVYWGRALFATGDAAGALDAIRRAEDLARRNGATAVLFLAALGRAEGLATFERWDEYAEQSEALLDLTMAHLPQWENVARFHRAQALHHADDAAAAQSEIRLAIAACPAGADGWRWRRRCEAARLVIDHAASGDYDQEHAENLTDELLVARWFGAAVEFMTDRAAIESDPELARHAATLADELGNLPATVRAVHAAEAWDEPASARVADKVRGLADRLPPEWQQAWRELPQVTAALGHTGAVDEETPEFREALAEAWAGLGLAEGDAPLSPSQRQAAGAVRRRPARTASRAAALLIGAAAVVALSVGATFALGGFDRSPGGTVVIERTIDRTTTTQFVLEQNVVPVPEDGLAGSAEWRGSPLHDGVFDAAGVPEVGGIYWTFAAGDVIRTSPVAFGKWVYFGSSDHFIYAVDQTTGAQLWRMETGGPVLSTPTVGSVDIGESTLSMLVAGSNDGRVYARDAINSNQRPLWQYEIGEPVLTTPIVFRIFPPSGDRYDMVAVSGGDGRLHGLAAGEGTVLWQYPSGDPGPPMTGSPTASDGIIYVGDEAGTLHLVDAITGEGICTLETGAAIRTAPAISDGIVYVGTQGGNLFQFPEGRCPSLVEAQPLLLGVDLNDEVAVADGVVYYADGPRLTAMSVPDGTILWVIPDLTDTGPPVIAGDMIYAGSVSGFVLAATLDGEEVWRFDAGGRIVTSPAVGSDVIFVTSETGQVFAIAPR